MKTWRSRVCAAFFYDHEGYEGSRPYYFSHTNKVMGLRGLLSRISWSYNEDVAGIVLPKAIQFCSYRLFALSPSFTLP